jgi:hypothetical protein
MGHTLKVADQLRDAAIGPCAAEAPPSIDISLDTTFVRRRHEGERHMQVRVGNVEAPDGGGKRDCDRDATGLSSRRVLSLHSRGSAVIRTPLCRE